MRAAKDHVDPAALESALQEQWLAAQAGYRTPSAIASYLLALAAMMALGFSRTGESVLGATRRDLAIGLGAILVVMTLAVILYGTRGLGSNLYRVADHLETITIQSVALGLVARSGHGQSPFWLVYLAHMTMLPVEPRAAERRLITALLCAGPTLLTIYFLFVAGSPPAAALSVGGLLAGVLTWRATQSKKEALAAELVRSREAQAAVDRLRIADERVQIAKELHGGLGRDLVELVARAEVLLPRSESAVQAGLRGLVDRSKASLDELRSMVWFVEGPSRPWHDFVDHAEERLVDLVNHRAVLELHAHDRGSAHNVPAEVCLALVRMLQESARNALIHGGAKTVRVKLSRDESSVRAEVEDDGRGIPPAPRPGGKGLSNMRARAAALGGTFDLSSTEAGTRVAVHIPHPPPRSSTVAGERR